MAAQSHSRFADRVISRLAAQQEGVVGGWQLLAAGVTRHQIATRVASGALVQLHRGVYLVGALPSAYAHDMAALLAYRLKASLSHRSAASLWRLLSYPATAPVWVTIPPERNATRPRIKAIRARLDRQDIRRRRALLLTSPPRTILDMAALLDAYDLEAVVAEGSYRGLASEAELADQVERNPHKRGVVALRHVLDLPGGPRRTRSPAERQLLGLLRKHAIDDYEANAEVLGYEVDFLWRERGFVVEVDGWDGHAGRVAFERDRLKWARLEAAGIAVMPITGRQVQQDPEGVVARLQAALRVRR